jgi:hypothetical protein
MRKTTTAAVVVAVMLAIPVTLYASHQFNDVPSSHTFHEAISWMADNGITQGCNPPANTNYCPENSVTRGQMAGFMKRFHDTFIAGGASGIGLGFATRSVSDATSAGNGVVQGLSLNVDVSQSGILVAEEVFNSPTSRRLTFRFVVSTSARRPTLLRKTHYDLLT